LLYNQISETCFKKCANTFLSREITPDEVSIAIDIKVTLLKTDLSNFDLKLQDICVNNCAQKYIYANHKVMEIFMEVQPIMVRKRMEEMNAAALEEQNQQQAEQNVQ